MQNTQATKAQLHAKLQEFTLLLATATFEGGAIAQGEDNEAADEFARDLQSMHCMIDYYVDK